MTPQSNFMVLAPIVGERETTLRDLLTSMNHAAGQVDPTNKLIPFGEFDMLHFARLLVLDDRTTGDVEAYGMAPPAYPRYLAFLGDVDGDEVEFLEELVIRAGDGLRKIFLCCEGFSSGTDLLDWMMSHRSPPIASYVNCRGRTVRQVREEAVLHDAIEHYLDFSSDRLQSLPPREIHGEVRRFVDGELAAGRVKLSAEMPAPVGWSIRNALHFAGWPIALLAISPLLLVAAPFYLYLLRQLEKSDPELCGTVDQAYTDELSRHEDHDVTNQFSAMGTLKPGYLRLLTTVGVLGTVNYAARHIVRAGRLGRIRSIHFARWVFLDDKKRMVFFSNYDGSVESYMDDFINKTGFGLNASFSNGIGYPRTNWLLLDGCGHERKYKEFLRRHTLASQVWYKAYPGLTAIDLERNTLIRRGLDHGSMTEREAREWVALL